MIDHKKVLPRGEFARCIAAGLAQTLREVTDEHVDFVLIMCDASEIAVTSNLGPKATLALLEQARACDPLLREVVQ